MLAAALRSAPAVRPWAARQAPRAAAGEAHAGRPAPRDARKPASPRRRRAGRAAAFHVGQQDPSLAALTAERSMLINKEVVLFLFQLEMDSQLQRALTYERFDMAQEVRARREQIDAALRELQQIKGPGCGARVAARSDQMEYAPRIITLKAKLAEAIEMEQYDEAAGLRDRLKVLEGKAAEAAELAAQYLCPVEEPRFCLGEMVVHSSKGYRGVICGWDLACCESAEWQEEAGVSDLRGGSEQHFYHVLVDARDWPLADDQPPVAYIAEELLTAGSSADFSSNEPLVDGSFEHPYSYLMFLGADGQGNMVPARQLRDKYCVERRDVYSPGESRWEEEGDDGNDGGDGEPGSGGDGPDGPEGGQLPRDAAGRRVIPGIDMSSLD
ncbi:F-box only 21 [Micractinium conductrix]|uniref:F-box only 21 n=1 Tax=Micractinium conductrix TaxID=554055 RepID=A0A2P6VQY0_9CHLO|nr:F-box only 21 [Micractinium conductrix]|eukprot:PSC76506.1 F-box only 21 [Micractinium conductrix]